jgi:dihydroxyacetone kinase-like protein
MDADLDLEGLRAMMLHVAQGIEASVDHLSELDRAIGDGDHGIGMGRGFEAVRGALEAKTFESVGKLFQAVGTTLMMSIGGAAGAIFGTLFRGGAAKLLEEKRFTSAALARLLADGLAAVQARGGAKPGNKTMVDALVPASLSAQASTALPLREALAAAASAAHQGVEDTRGMLATLGKAKTLGERALGHPDPGAESMYLILKLMAEAVAGGGRA